MEPAVAVIELLVRSSREDVRMTLIVEVVE
jgi:hypothetical protein